MSINDFLAKVGIDEKLRTRIMDIVNSGKSLDEIIKEFGIDCTSEELMEAVKGLKDGKIPTDVLGKVGGAVGKLFGN